MDSIQLASGDNAYRFTITPENNTSDTAYTSDAYVCIEEMSHMLKGKCTNKNNVLTGTWITAIDRPPKSEVLNVFDIPSDYTEITYAEYQQNLA